MDITYEEAIQRLKNRKLELGSQKRLALKLNVTDPYLSDVFSGRRAMGPKILEELNLTRITTVVYRELIPE